jgi:hypothetical protein
MSKSLDSTQRKERESRKIGIMRVTDSGDISYSEFVFESPKQESQELKHH